MSHHSARHAVVESSHRVFAATRLAGRARTIQLGVALLLALLFTSFASAQSLVATLNVGTNPKAFATNPATNTIFVANNGSGSVTAINGATNATVTIIVGSNPTAIAINPVTNKIYVANSGSGNVTVIDGATNTTSTVTTGTSPSALAVNTATNKIYVANSGSGNITVIDGATNTTATVSAGSVPYAVALNPVTNKVYVANFNSMNVTVIDGATNSTTPVTVGTGPAAIAVNAATNVVYVADSVSNDVTVIDGSSNSTATVGVGTSPSAIAIDSATNKIFVANQGSGNVTVIDGSTNTAVATISAGTGPDAIGVDMVLDKIFVANGGSGNVTVIDGAANSSLATIGAGSSPSAVAVDPVSSRVYVANNGGASVTVIDEDINSKASIGTGTGPIAVAANAATNTIFVANETSGTVTVIDGSANTTTSVNVGNAPEALVVNAVTNKVFVVNSGDGTVTAIDGATNATATIGVGSSPNALAVNTATNKVYVANGTSNSVTAIDGATHVTTTIPVGTAPDAVAINQQTNKVYVANGTSGNVTVIDGATNTTTLIGAGTDPVAVAVNAATNKVYVANHGSGNVTVIDGGTGSTTTVTADSLPVAVVANPLTNKVYVANQGGNNVTVIDGATNSTTTVGVGTAPSAIALNLATNQVYVANSSSGSVTVIDGATNATSTVTVGTNPSALAVNLGTNKVYVTDQGSSDVMAISPGTVQSLPLTSTVHGTVDAQTVGGNAIFSTTESAPSFTATAASTYSPTAPSPSSLYYQVDTTAGAWSPATATGAAGSNPAGYSFTLSSVPVGVHTVYVYAADDEQGTTASSSNSGANSPEIGGLTAYTFAVLPQQGAASLSQSSMAFGNQGVGQTSNGPYYYETVTNLTGNALSLSGIGAVGDFGVTGNSCGSTLAANATCTFYVTFTPSTTGPENATMYIVAGTMTLPLSLNGTGVPSSAVLYQNSITFGIEGVGQTSTGIYEAVSNFTGGAVALSGIGAVGDFGVSISTCGSILPNNNTCIFFVTFTPTQTGTRSATMNIMAGGTSLPLALSGTGLPSAVILSQNSIAFGSHGIHLASSPISVVVYNLTGSGAALSGITAPSSDFGVTSNNCPATLASGASCTFSVNFTPVTTGAKSATMNIVGGGAPLPLALTGTGSPNVVTVSQSSMAFGNQGVGQTSNGPYYWETVSNFTAAPIALSGIGAVGDFGVTNNSCGSTLASNSTCTFYVTLTPSSPGAENGTMNIVAGGTTFPLILTGTGVPSIVVLYRSPIAFGNTTLGQTSAGVYNSISNFTGSTVSLSGIGVAGDFGVTGNTCGATLANNAMCFFFVTFTPSAMGPRSATMNIMGGSTALPLALSGTGVSLLSQSSMTFGNQGVGQTSNGPYYYETLTNLSGNAISLSGIAAVGDFGVTSNSCGATLAANATCTFYVTFTPSVGGSQTVTMNIVAGGTTFPLTLTGTGVPSIALLYRNPMAFGNQGLGQTSTAVYNSIGNFTGATVSLSGIGSAGDFGVTGNTCGATLANNAMCYFYVTFTPSAMGSRSATMNIVAGGSPLPLSLSGTGVATVASLSQNSIAFGSRGIGLASSPISVTVYNRTASAVALSGIAAPSADFGVTSNNCPATLASGSSCVFAVNFTPSTTGLKSATINILAGSTPLPLALTGTGALNTISISKSSMAFGNQGVGQTSNGPYYWETLSNFTGSAVSVSGIGAVGDFGVTNNTCGSTLANNSTCTFYVTLTPSSLGAENKTMNIVIGGTTYPLTMTGTGVPSAVLLYRNPIAFGSETVGVTSSAVYNAISNFTGSTVSLSGIGAVGDYGVVSNTCGATLTNNATCYFYVTFTPSATGARPATMNINGGGTALPLTLTGTGK